MARRLATAASLLILAAAQLTGLSANRTCPEVNCPEQCELETKTLEHRCAWCVCSPITARETLKKFEERHCPKPLMDHVKRLSQSLKSQIFQLSNDVRQQNVVLKNVERLHRNATQDVHPNPCPTPMCARNCTIVTGDNGCPDCECPPTHCPRQRCPSGCHQESPPPSDRCPACVCDGGTEGQHGGDVALGATFPATRRPQAERRADDSSEESSEGDDGSVAPHADQRQCATPVCSPNCTLVTGDHGCPDCECPPTHCPRRRCPRFCHRESPPPADRCPECICDVTRGRPDRGQNSVLPPARARRYILHEKEINESSEESSEESDGEGGTVRQGGPSRTVRAKRDSQNGHQGRKDDSSEESSEEREDTRDTESRGGRRIASGTAIRAKMGSQNGHRGRKDDSSEESSEETGGTAALRVDPRNCATPLCGRNCTIVTGDHGCPVCECPPTHCPRRRCPRNCHRESPAPTDRCPECVCDVAVGGTGSQAESGAVLSSIIRFRREIRDRHRSQRHEDSSEESSEEKDGRGGSTKRGRSDDSSEESREDTSRVVRQKRHHHLGGHGYRHQDHSDHARTAAQATENGVQAGEVQCATPHCEQHCTTKLGPHGCLVCDCPDICPDIVCGSGCHPEHTERRRCERCICSPHTQRQTVEEVFNAHCGEGNLRALLIEFVNLRKTLDVLEQQLAEHDQDIRRIETLHETPAA